MHRHEHGDRTTEIDVTPVAHRSPGKLGLFPSTCLAHHLAEDTVREFVNESAASAASLDYAKFQAVIKSAASAASLRGGCASGRLDHSVFSQVLAALAAKKYTKIVKISDSGTLAAELGLPVAQYQEAEHCKSVGDVESRPYW